MEGFKLILVLPNDKNNLVEKVLLFIYELSDLDGGVCKESIERLYHEITKCNICDLIDNNIVKIEDIYTTYIKNIDGVNILYNHCVDTMVKKENVSDFKLLNLSNANTLFEVIDEYLPSRVVKEDMKELILQLISCAIDYSSNNADKRQEGKDLLIKLLQSNKSKINDIIEVYLDQKYSTGNFKYLN